MAQTGILDYSRYLNTLQTLSEIGNTFPSSQNTYNFSVGGTTSTQGWTATISWNTLIVDDYVIKTNGEPDFENSKVIGYFTTGTANQYSTGTISIPANIYLGSILPGTTYHTPITVVNVEWIKDGINYAVNLGFIQNWEPGVVLGDPYFDDGFEPVISERSTLTLVGPGRVVFNDDVTLSVTTDIPLDLPVANRTVYFYYDNGTVRQLLGSSQFIDKSATFTFNTAAVGFTGGTYPIYAEYFGFREYGLSRSNVLQQVVADAIPLLVESESVSPLLDVYYPGVVTYDINLIPDPQYYPDDIPVANAARIKIAKSPIGLYPTDDVVVKSADLVDGNISSTVTITSNQIDLNLSRTDTIYTILTGTIFPTYYQTTLSVSNTASIKTEWDFYRPGPYAAGSHEKIISINTTTIRNTFGEAFPLTVTRTPEETYWTEPIVITVDGRNNRQFYNTISLIGTATIFGSNTSTVIATFTATNTATNTYSVEVDSLGSGTWHISAVYPGDIGSSIFIANLPSTSNTISHVIRPGNTLDAILTFQRTADADILRLVANTSTTMTNTVSFFQGSTLLGTADWVATTTAITKVISQTTGYPAINNQFVPAGGVSPIANSSNGFPSPYNTATITFRWPYNPIDPTNLQSTGWINWPGDRGKNYVNRKTKIVLNSNSPQTQTPRGISATAEADTIWDLDFPNDFNQNYPTNVDNFPTFYTWPNRHCLYGENVDFDIDNDSESYQDPTGSTPFVFYSVDGATVPGQPNLGNTILGFKNPITNLPRTFTIAGQTITVTEFVEYGPMKVSYISRSNPPGFGTINTTVGPNAYQYKITPSLNGETFYKFIYKKYLSYDGSLSAHRDSVANYGYKTQYVAWKTALYNSFISSSNVTIDSTEVTTTSTVITGYNPNNRVATLILPRGTITSLETTHATWPGTMNLPRQYYKYLPIDVYAQLPPSVLTLSTVSTYSYVSAYETQALNPTFDLALEDYTANTIYPTNPVRVNASVFVNPDYYSGLTQGTVTFFNTQTGAVIGSTSTVDGIASLDVSIDNLTTSTSTVNVSIGATFDGDSSLNSTATQILTIPVAASTGTLVPFAFASNIVPNITNYSLALLDKADFSAGNSGDVKLNSALNALIPFAAFRGIRSTVDDKITYNRDMKSYYNFTFRYRIYGTTALINPNSVSGSLFYQLIYRSGSGAPFPQARQTTNTVAYTKYNPLKYQVAQWNGDTAGMALYKGKADLDYTYTPWAPILAEFLADNTFSIVTSTGVRRNLLWSDTWTYIEVIMDVDCAYLNATYLTGASRYYGTSSNPQGSKIVIDKHAFRLYST